MTVPQVLALCLGLVGAFVLLVVGAALFYLYWTKKRDEIAAIDRLTETAMAMSRHAQSILGIQEKLTCADSIAAALPSLIEELFNLRIAIDKSAAAPDRLSEVVDKLSPVANEFAKVPDFINGHAKAAAAIVMQVAKLDKTVNAFSQMLIDPTAQRQALSEATEEGGAKQFEIMQVLVENPGMTLQAASDLADQNILKRASMPQISMD